MHILICAGWRRLVTYRYTFEVSYANLLCSSAERSVLGVVLENYSYDTMIHSYNSSTFNPSRGSHSKWLFISVILYGSPRIGLSAQPRNVHRFTRNFNISKRLFDSNFIIGIARCFVWGGVLGVTSRLYLMESCRGLVDDEKYGTLVLLKKIKGAILSGNISQKKQKEVPENLERRFIVSR